MASWKRIKKQSKKLAFEALETRRLLASDWQNPGQGLDVSRDLTVSPVDALLGINRLNSSLSRTFPARAVGSTEPYFDVDGSGVHSPVDVLLVINALNRRVPTVSVELTGDSGVGPGANSDRRTKDLSVRGNISLANATQLWGRYEGDAQWHDLSSFLVNQTFSIKHVDLVKALGQLPNDGPMKLQFQPRYGASNTEIGSGADLRVTLDLTPPQFNFGQQPNFLGAISAPLSTVIEVPLNERVSPLTLDATKVKLFDARFNNLQETPPQLTPRGISLSADGRSLLIEPPTNSNSTSYLVKVQTGAFEDIAGNLNDDFDTIVNHFNSSSQTPLLFGQKIDASSVQQVVKEYTFSVASPELFILAGLEADAEMQLDLFAPSGRIVQGWVTPAEGGSLSLFDENWTMLTELGTYTLRVALPAAGVVSFKALLSSQLTNAPAPLQGTFTWTESQAFAIDVTTQDRVFFQNDDSQQAAFRVTLLTQYGQPVSSSDLSNGDFVFSVPGAGRYIALIEGLTDVRPETYNYTVHLSQSTRLPLILGEFQENTLTIPGQQVFYTFAAQAGRSYTLEFVSETANVAISLPPSTFEVDQATEFPATESGAGYVLLSLNRGNLPPGLSQFRLVESNTSVIPPVAPTIHTEPLVEGVNKRDILLPDESYEFTFTGTTGELYAFGETVPFVGDYKLLAPTGSEVSAIEQTDAFRVFRIPYSGQYRVRATAAIDEEISFQWQKLSTASQLVATGAVSGNVGVKSFETFRFVANSSRFYVFPTASTVGKVWRLIDDNGAIVIESYFSETLDVAVVSGRSYSLIIEKELGQPGSFGFSRLAPTTTSQAAALGETLTGSLATRGTRVIIELSLTAGQLIDLTSNVNTNLATVRWLDLSINESENPIDIDANVPTLIGSTRKYRVEIETITSTAVNYSVSFDSVQPTVMPPSTQVGFDQIRSGNLTGAPESFTFDVSAGTYFMFDWLLEENFDLLVDITDPSGNLVPSVSFGGDSSLTYVDTAGPIMVQISSSEPTPYSFRMISPSSGEAVALGAKKSASVIPFGSAFYRVPLSQVTEVFLQSSSSDLDNSVGLYRLGTRDPFNAPAEGPFLNGQFHVGEAFVWATNLVNSPFSTEFTPLEVATVPIAALNSPITLQTVPGFSYIVPFKTTVADTIIGAIINAGTFALVDQGGTIVDPILSGTAYQLKQPGDYRVIVFASSASTEIELHTQVATNASATIATTISGTLDKVGDVKRYSITLSAGMPIVVTPQLSEGAFALWVSPNGQVFTPPLGETSVLPVYTSGTYQLEIRCAQNGANFKVELNDLSQAGTVVPGTTSGNTGSGLMRINRFTAAPRQLLELQGVSEQAVDLNIVDRLGNTLLQFAFGNRVLSQMPDDGVAYILISPRSGNQSVAFAYSLDLVTLQTQAATLGQPITGSLAQRLEGKGFTFQVTEPTWLRIGSTFSQSAFLVLRMPDGNLLVSSEGFTELALAGDYEVQLYNESRTTNNFSLTIDLLSQTPVVPLNQTTTITKSGRYRVDIPASGRFELQLQNVNNELLSASELILTNVNGAEIGFNPRGTLAAGSYWLSISPSSTLPSGDYKLKLTSLTTTESNLAVGSLGEFTLNANGLQEHIVTVQLVPGMRLLIDELELGSGGSVEARFNERFETDWSPFDLLPFIVLGTTGEETLQFRISGTGLVRLHMVDLNAAAPLTLGSATSVELNARRRGQAWTIGGNVGDTIEFINDSTAARPVRWLIIDESGNSIDQFINQPINFTIVNRQRYSLVVVATELLTTPLTIPFHTELF